MSTPTPSSSSGAPSHEEPSSTTRRHEQGLSSTRTIVVKVGTNVLSRPTGEISLGRVSHLVEELVDLTRAGKRPILVTSGAISLGMDRLGLAKRPEYLRDKQACAAIGQIRLMATYQQAFDRYGVPTAQVLLTEDDFSSRQSYLNLRNALTRLLELGVVPIVNENDVVSTSEIESRGAAEGVTTPRGTVFGDNDRLSALVASKLDADLLIVLSDVEGLYPRSPGTGEQLAAIPTVERIDERIVAMASGGNARGRGGMASKIEAMRVVTQSGIPGVIANGTRPGVIARVLAGDEIGTLFLPQERISSKKRWIGFATSTTGRVRINAGASEAIQRRGSSLLFAGVVAIETGFRRGDIVSIVDEHGEEIARGIANHDAHDAASWAGKRSEEILALVGRECPELVTRDNIALRR